MTPGKFYRKEDEEQDEKKTPTKQEPERAPVEELKITIAQESSRRIMEQTETTEQTVVMATAPREESRTAKRAAESRQCSASTKDSTGDSSS